MGLFTRKPLSILLAEAADTEKGLKRTLTAGGLVALGIGAIIGAGLFVRTAAAAAQNAGPSVTFGFILAAIGCAFAGLCYAELSSSIPISGSAYTFTYATMGEMLAWIIGWDLVLEYAVGAATVGIAWSEYLNNLLVQILHWKPIAYEWCHSPFQELNTINIASATDALQFSNYISAGQLAELSRTNTLNINEDVLAVLPETLKASVSSVQGIMNIPALFIVTLMSLLLIKGTSESSFVNSIIVIVKVTIVLLIIFLGWNFINPANHTPYIPTATKYVDHQGVTHNFGGVMGILGAAGTVFFAFIGFDAVSTAAQETKNPKRALPIGILGSLVICTTLYLLFGHVLTGLAPVEFFRDPTKGGEASVVAAIQSFMPGYKWLSDAVTIAILAGFTSVILVMLLGQSRVFYSMSKDGLLPASFSQLHSKFQTPFKGNLIILLLVGLFAAFVPGDVVGHMTSIGTLFAFILVCAAVIILRKKEPNMKREFKTPFVPLFPILGIIACLAMILGLGWENWARLLVWLALGFIIYFGYSKKHSKLRDKK
ncbi:APC family permease [Niabella ginsengisoli]|uniref:Amino acid permease n=1 Tax=Niabella ginsengisoli TaxID=522298 RepID=A0ABS9SGC0_9BACT|nr:amino acid permease [Niabella ginsengisoli]MCH5597406.1 amino acid permease [Niabella ginsengisoli]